MLNKLRNSCKSSSTKSKEMPKTSKKDIIDAAFIQASSGNAGKNNDKTSQNQRILNLDYGRWEASIGTFK